MKVLVTGADGQLGRELVRQLGSQGVGFGRAALDITDRTAVLATVSSVRPDVVVNAAAWTAVDACEADEEKAFEVNALGVRWVAEACHRVDAHLVQISTDYVFDGTKTAPYVEDDTPNPINVYGASKLAGEREAGPDATIVRTSWLFSDEGPSIVQTILRLAATHDELRFVDDRWGCPTYAPDLVEMLLAVARRPAHHVVHAVNPGAMTWYELARIVCDAAGYDASRVVPITSSEQSRPAQRPANCVLASAVEGPCVIERGSREALVVAAAGALR